MKRSIVISVLFLTSYLFGQNESIFLHPNRGQWGAQIYYNVEIHNGNFFLDKSGYTINVRRFNHHDDLSGKSSESGGYALKLKYLGEVNDPIYRESNPSPFYRNYFLGNDSSKWKKEIYSYKSVLRKNLYDGIDVETRGNSTGDFEILYYVSPHKSAKQLQLKHEGFDKVELLKNGSLRWSYPLGEMTESAPKAWNVLPNGQKKEVPIEYRVDDNIVSFDFPEGYDENLMLEIDPVLAFSTFTGSTSDNWGFTAAPDPQGNVFGGGIVFGPNYPLTVGAYDSTFGGGTVDIAISKFSSDGTQLLYSTFIGGSSAETPHSIISNQNGEIYVMGITSSTNFPITAGAYQPVYGGGSSFTIDNISFLNGSDIYVLKLNTSGTSLMSSTYMGGTGNDGISRHVLSYNYGDQFRGDITLDNSNNVYVASTTYSTDFPTANATATANSGLQDATAFMLNSSLTNLGWSTYLGGSGYDAAYSIQVGDDGSVFIAGGSNSTNLIFPSGVHTTNNGGIDGFIAKYNSSHNLVNGTFVGTSAYDQVYFVELDLMQDVYVLGQTLGTMQITTGKYGVQNSSQFIKKFNNNLSVENWTTLIGSGFKRIDISPTAFLVSDCYDIYLAGWGGLVNRQNSQATQSSTNGLPISTDGYQKTTNGNNFYIAVLGKNANSFKYGTFMGGVTSSANHVDGGTSRFDKNGKMYHAVCGACGGNSNGFTTTPGAYSTTNNSSNCNMAVFKFELSFIDVNVTEINPIICFPDQITFNNVTTTGNSFFWDFGDGATSTLLSPTHAYTQPGTYTVNFVVKDTANCYVSDTTNFEVVVKDFNGSIVSPPDSICPLSDVQLHASGGMHYSWSPAQLFDDPSVADPIINLNSTSEEVTVVITDDDCGSDTLKTTIHLYNDSILISKDTTICLGDTVRLSANGLASYLWSPANSLDDPTNQFPLAFPNETTTYSVSGHSLLHGCLLSKNTTVNISEGFPNPVMPDSIGLCFGQPATVTVSGADSYLWSPQTNISPTTGHTVTISSSVDRYYYCDFSTVCGTIRDSIFAFLDYPIVKAFNDTAICPGNRVELYATGAENYSWWPFVDALTADNQVVSVAPDISTTFYVSGTDKYGCVANDSVTIILFPKPYVKASPDVYAIFNEKVPLGITTPLSPGYYIWSPFDFLSCDSCVATIANPNKDYIYKLTYIDTNGCFAEDYVHIHYDPLLWVPNTFTPDGSGINDGFRFYGVNISNVKMDIYDRWGELIHTIHGFDEFWDGTYQGMPCPIGTYVWKITYTNSITEMIDSKVGHVNLIR